MKYTLFLLTALAVCPVHAEMKPIESGADHRIKVITYIENEVVNLLSHYGYSVTITYADDEEVYPDSISTGDPQGWHLLPLGNTLVLKPKLQNNTTNLTVRTSKRDYHYLLQTRTTTDPNSKNLTFAVKYTYPGDIDKTAQVSYLLRKKREALEQQNHHFREEQAAKKLPGIHLDNMYFGYTFTGDTDVVPTQTFDDGLFTYMKFEKNSPIPAVFSVDKKRNESLVNFRMEGDYMVIEQLGDQFTLRYNDVVASVFKEKDYKKVIRARNSNPNDVKTHTREGGADYPYATW